jgi:glycosyltransferase involved in cell wall biosynthesis
MVRIAYVGDLIGHGKSLQTPGTSFIILLSLLESVDSIDVFCPERNQNAEELKLPPKVRLFEFYKYDDLISIMNLLKIRYGDYGAVIFNMIPTGYGKGTLANAFALFVPILMVKLFRHNNIKLIYHNSVFTNDVQTLGYNSSIDKIRSFFLGIVEMGLFKSVDTFVLLDIYKRRIDESIEKNRVRVLKSRYLEAIPTLYMNNVMQAESLKLVKSQMPTILMHGFWGPQKNLELGLSALRDVKETGIKFRLLISGGLNHHFSDYEKKFQELLHANSDIIDEYLGQVPEKDIMKIFLTSDLLILPYNTPGGHSGVLEQAIFFEVPTIAIDFPEYREQTRGCPNIQLVSPHLISKAVATMLSFNNEYSTLNIHKKICEAVKSQEDLLL